MDTPLSPIEATLRSVSRLTGFVTRRWLGVAATLILALGLVLSGCGQPADEPPTTVQADASRRAPVTATYLGRDVCAECHGAEMERWTGSHHDLAMDVATDSTVLGDFNNTSITSQGVTTTFRRDGDRFLAETEGPDGSLQEFEISHTFGVDPLQQYLIPFPRGAYQVLGIAWDSRAREAGGQRWYSLYPDDRFLPGDPLHWTGWTQNWNHSCAGCHSTGLEKRFDPDTETYGTVYAEIDVSCEACHGPGSDHVEWARTIAAGGKLSENRVKGLGLTVDYRESVPANWVFSGDDGIARREPPRTNHVEIETCAPCHSRRTAVWEPVTPGDPFLDNHRPALLTPGLYTADGQIEDEVYVYGSFLQSRMYGAGVVCSDCHDPHTARLRTTEPDDTCARCHLPEVFDTPKHHFHEPESAGASCIGCHMTERTYMGVDGRRDHSFRVPRPDLTEALDTRDACTDCHTDRDPAWASERAAGWWGMERRERPHYGEVLEAGRLGGPGAGRALAELILDTTQPIMARATAASLLRSHLGTQTLPALQAGLADPSPLVRLGALSTLEAVSRQGRAAMGAGLMEDPIRVVRTEAARILVDAPRQSLSDAGVTARQEALSELVQGCRINADVPWSYLNLGALFDNMGDPDRAEVAYRTALGLDSTFVPAFVNLADLYGRQGNDAPAEPILRRAVGISPDDAGIHHALALNLTRLRRGDEALEEFRLAAELGPEVPRYAYAYGVALNSLGDQDHALEVLSAAHERAPGNRDLLVALVTISRDLGYSDMATRHARTLLALDPEDPTAQELLRQVGGTP